LIALAVILLDQVTKAWIWNMLGPEEGTSVPVLGSWLSFTFVKNTGISFGLFRGIPHFFTITSVLISIGAILFYRYHLPNHRPWVQISLGLIVGGAIGNIIDRLRLGFVIDFVHVSWFPGIFNVADSAITIGVIMLAGYLLLYGDSPSEARRDSRGDEALLGELLSKDQWAQRKE
jgi:signal peptidase II